MESIVYEQKATLPDLQLSVNGCFVILHKMERANVADPICYSEKNLYKYLTFKPLVRAERNAWAFDLSGSEVGRYIKVYFD